MTAAAWEVRTGQPADLERVLSLDRSTATAPHWPEMTYTALLASGESQASVSRQLLVAASDGLIAGFVVASVQRLPDETLAELESIVVAPESQRLGLGRLLSEAAIVWAASQGATSMALEVRSQSVGAQALYRSLGFTEEGRRPRYYADPVDDAVFMRRGLAQSPANNVQVSGG